MANELPDLWGKDVNVAVVTPLVILKAQSDALGRRTQGIVTGDLTRRLRADVSTLFFDVIAAISSRIRRRLVVVKHNKELAYPCMVGYPFMDFGKFQSASPLLIEEVKTNQQTICETQQIFINIVTNILQSSQVSGLIESLVAASNESKMDYIPIPTEDLTDVNETS